LLPRRHMTLYVIAARGDHGGRCDRSDSGITAYFISYGPALGFKSSAYGPPDHIGWPA